MTGSMANARKAPTLHYCVDARDPDLPVARKIGAAIATALLLQPREHVIGENVAGESLDNLYQVFPAPATCIWASN